VFSAPSWPLSKEAALCPQATIWVANMPVFCKSTHKLCAEFAVYLLMKLQGKREERKEREKKEEGNFPFSQQCLVALATSARSETCHHLNQ